MKLNLLQLIAFAFVLGWVGGDVAQVSYEEKLIGITWNGLKKISSKILSR